MGQLKVRADLARALRTPWSTVILWTVITVVVRLLWLRVHPPVTAWDGAIYERTAMRIAQGLGFVDTWNNRPPYHPTAFYPVGFPAVLGGMYAIFGVHPWVVGALNVTASAVGTAVATWMARRAYGAVSGHVAGALLTLSPGAILYTSAYMTETLSAALLSLTMLTALHHARTGRAWSAAVTGVLLGVGGLVRPPALLIAPCVALLMVPTASWRHVLRTTALVGVCCAATVLPWTVRNCARLDGCAIVSVNGGSNLWIGTDAAAHGGYRDLRVGEGCDRVFGEVAKDRCYAQLAVRRIAHDPIAWLALTPEKVDQLLYNEASPVAYLRSATHGAMFATHADEWFRGLAAYQHALLGLSLLAFVPLAGRRRPRREVVLAIGTTLALVAVHAIFFGADRYHYVFAPLLAMLASSALREREPDALA